MVWVGVDTDDPDVPLNALAFHFRLSPGWFFRKGSVRHGVLAAAAALVTDIHEELPECESLFLKILAKGRCVAQEDLPGLFFFRDHRGDDLFVPGFHPESQTAELAWLEFQGQVRGRPLLQQILDVLSHVLRPGGVDEG